MRWSLGIITLGIVFFSLIPSSLPPDTSFSTNTPHPALPTATYGTTIAMPPAPADLAAALDGAESAGLTTVRLTGWLAPDAADATTAWPTLDTALQAAGADGLTASIDLTPYRDWLVKHGQAPDDPARWNTFLDGLGQRYAASTTLAGYLFPTLPAGGSNPTVATRVAFLTAAVARLAAADGGSHALAPGDLPATNTDWQRLAAVAGLNLLSVVLPPLPTTGADPLIAIAAWATAHHQALAVLLPPLPQGTDADGAAALRSQLQRVTAVAASPQLAPGTLDSTHPQTQAIVRSHAPQSAPPTLSAGATQLVDGQGRVVPLRAVTVPGICAAGSFTPTTAATITGWGLNAVWFPLDPLCPATALAAALRHAHAAGLTTILGLSGTPEDGASRATWQALAQNPAIDGATILALPSPSATDLATWQATALTAIDAMRAVAPNSLLLISAPPAGVTLARPNLLLRVTDTPLATAPSIVTTLPAAATDLTALLASPNSVLVGTWEIGGLLTDATSMPAPTALPLWRALRTTALGPAAGRGAYVAGTLVRADNDRALALRGVALGTLDTQCQDDGHGTLADFLALRRWGATVVRFPLSAPLWLNANNRCPTYPDRVAAAVTQAEAAGLDVILSLQRVAPFAAAEPNPNGAPYPLPDRVGAVAFWTALAAHYANDDRVIFEPYAEPHDISWSQWRSGGQLTISPNGEEGGGTYDAIGMADLVAQLRQMAPARLLLVDGNTYGTDLSGLTKGQRLPQSGLIYGLHLGGATPTPGTGDPASWTTALGDLVTTVPVMASDLTATDLTTDLRVEAIAYFPVGAVVQTWTTSGPQALLAPGTWDGTPSLSGAPVRTTLRALALPTLVGTPALAITGNQVVDALGQPETLRGAARWSLEYSCTGDGHFSLADFLAMRSWGMNTVRIPLNSWYWLFGDAPVPPGGGAPTGTVVTSCTPGAYQATVASAVQAAESAGLQVILVDQWSHPNCNCPTNEGTPPMAYPWDQTFWDQVAVTFAGDPHIGFVPFSEPHTVSLAEWSGGWQGGPGMRDLVATIAAAAPGQLILVSGLSYADDLSFLNSSQAITGPEIGYELHIYQYWNPAAIAPFQSKYAVLAGEFGINDATSPQPHDYTQAVMTAFEQPGSGYFAWAWGTKPAGDANPVLFQDDWVHLSTFGREVQTSLAAYAPVPPPTVGPTPAPTVTSTPGGAGPTSTPTATTIPGGAGPTPTPGSVLSDGFHTPAMGWNHYNHFGNTIDETTVRAIIDAMAANGMRDAGYRFINLDDSWQGTRDAHGHLQTNGQFPSGIRALADYAHSKGFKFGIYTTPGTTSCGGNTGSRGHVQQDISDFAAWGVDYVKLDICGDAWGDDIRADVHQFAQAIAATGRPMVLSLSSGGADQPWTWAAQEGLNSWRIGDDICQAWVVTNRDDSHFCYRPPAGGVLGIITGADGSHLADSASGTGPGHVPDPDMLEVGNPGLTVDEAQTHFSFWALASAPLIAGNDPRTLDDATRAILLNSEMIAIDQDPLVKAGTKIKDVGGLAYWVKPLADGSSAVLIFNANDQATPTSLQWSDLGLAGARVTRDLWAHTTLGTLTGWQGTIPAHGVVVFRLTPPPGA